MFVSYPFAASHLAPTPELRTHSIEHLLHLVATHTLNGTTIVDGEHTALTWLIRNDVEGNTLACVQLLLDSG